MFKKAAEKICGGSPREIIRELGWIYAHARPYRGGILLHTLLTALAALSALAAGLMSKHLIDAVTGQGSSAIALIAALYVFVALFRIACSAASRRSGAKLSIAASNDIRAEVFSRFLQLDWQAAADHHSGELLSRIKGDVSAVAECIPGLIPGLISSAIQFAGTFVIIALYDPIMALIALLGAPSLSLASRSLMGKLRSYGEKTKQAQAELTAFFGEALQNLQAVKSLSLEKDLRRRLELLQSSYRQLSLDHNLFSLRINLLMSLSSLVISGLCFAWGVYRLWSGSISFGTMVLFIQLAGLLSAAFSSLVRLVPSAVSAAVSAGRLTAILDLPKEDIRPDSRCCAILRHAAEEGAVIRAQGLSLAYTGGEPILKSLDFRLDPGEIIGFSAPSGGGKTSLIRAFLSLISPCEGSLTAESGGISAELCPALRPLFSYVAQEKFVLSGTLAQSLRLSCPDAEDEQLLKALEDACALDFVQSLPQGINTPLKEHGIGFSEGQLQRLAIARAMLSPAPVMLLDEASSALDSPTEERIIKALRCSCARRGIILTSHRSAVLRHCDRVYALEADGARLMSPQEIEALK